MFKGQDLRIVFLRSNRISNRIGRPIRFRIEFSNRIGQVQTTVVYTLQRIFNPFHRYLFCICHEQEWCTQLSTCYSFQFSPKTRQTMPLYDYLTPKLEFKRKFNYRQSFLYKGRLTVQTIQKFWIGFTTNRIPNRKFDSKSNRISKLRRSLTAVSLFRMCQQQGSCQGKNRHSWNHLSGDLIICAIEYWHNNSFQWWNMLTNTVNIFNVQLTSLLVCYCYKKNNALTIAVTVVHAFLEFPTFQLSRASW